VISTHRVGDEDMGKALHFPTNNAPGAFIHALKFMARIFGETDFTVFLHGHDALNEGLFVESSVRYEKCQNFLLIFQWALYISTAKDARKYLNKANNG
jgi:hypothetical protein